ncbi:hypothetical protein AB205_0191600, partial [Aquarana catesbeiana]
SFSTRWCCFARCCWLTLLWSQLGETSTLGLYCRLLPQPPCSGGDEGGGSPEALRPTPCAQAAMDPGLVPMQGESLPDFQDRVVNRLRCIAKEEQKLAVMKDLRKNKSLHSKSGNSKRKVPKLKSREEALKKQEKLVASLTESSVFKEKYENEERLRKGKENACASTSQRVDSMDGGKEIAPANRSLQSAGNAGRDDVYPDREVSAGCEESHNDTYAAYTRSDFPTAEQECRMNIETAEQEGRMNAETDVFPTWKALLDDGIAGNCGTSGTMVSRTVVLEGRREDQVVGNLPNQISEVPMQPVNIPTQPVNVSSVPVRSYAKAVSGQNHAGGGRDPVVRLSPNAPSSIKCKNVLQLRLEGGGIPPIRTVVVDKVLAMGFKAEDIYALISPAGSYEYDLSFVRPELLDLFWERFEHVSMRLSKAVFSRRSMRMRRDYERGRKMPVPIPARGWTVWMGGKEVASHGDPSTTPVSGSVMSESVSAPFLSQQPGSSQEEVEENGGLLQTITEMESPLSGTDSSDEDLGNARGDDVYPDREVSAGCEKSHIDTNSAEQECRINIETAEQESRMNTETAGVFSKRKT